MSNYYFSKTTCAFYPVELLEAYKDAGTLPDDVVSVTDAACEKYTCPPPDGKTRGANNRGQPEWVDMPEPSKEDSILLATMKKQQLMTDAEEAIALLSRAAKYDIATEEEKIRLEELEKYTVLLSRINPDDAPKIDWPQPPA
ncbi:MULTISPECIES: tail fiber assembly protein [Serratia]|uniref:tail fiber assembly protein n=1 Tax=Serratia TaxID=613 RepID=UPI0006614BFA|nr:tail fiber assembly protein [Serratia sp. 506_PEND]